MCWGRHLAAVVQASAPQVRAPTECLLHPALGRLLARFPALCMVSCRYATRFIEMVVMLCADHGPAVSGAAHIAPSSLRCPPTCLLLRVRHA